MSEPVAKRAGQWRPWLEPSVAVAAGVVVEICNAVFFNFSSGGWLLGIASVIGGLLLAAQRLAVTAHINAELDLVREIIDIKVLPLERLEQYVDLSQRADYDALMSLVRRYSAIRETEFEPLKRQIVEDAIENLRMLEIDKRSSTLRTADYYEWLFRQFSEAEKGQYVHAVSLSSDEEWNDSELEKNFLSVNVEAGARGVDVSRIFIVASDRIERFVRLPPIDAHTVESPVPLTGYWVRREELEKQDRALLRQLKEGFIDFNGRVVLEDQFDPDGEARGQVTILEQDLNRMASFYVKLRKMAQPLSRNPTK